MCCSSKVLTKQALLQGKKMNVVLVSTHLLGRVDDLHRGDDTIAREVLK
jgi:hypothetical protein